MEHLRKKKILIKEPITQPGLLQSIYTGIDSALFVIDITKDNNFSFTSFNPAYEKLVGLTSEEARGKTPEELIPKITPKAASAMRSHFQRCLEKVDTIEYEEITSISGKDYWLLIRLTPLKDKKNKIFRLIGSVTNINKLKSIEQKLKESEKKYKDLFDNAKIGMYRSKLDGSKFIAVNKRVAEILGYTQEEMMNNPSAIRWAHKKERDMMIQQLKENGEVTDYEVEAIKKNGEIVHLLTTTKINKERGYMEGTVIDITGKKRTETELHLKNIVFESSIAAKSIADCEGIISHVNNAFLKLWRYKSKKEAIGNSVGDFFVNQEDAVPVLNALNKKGKWEGEFLAKRRDGSAFISRGLATVIKDKDGKMIGYQSANLDVTDQKNAEKEIKQKNEEYYSLYEEYLAQNEELQTNNEELYNEVERRRKSEEELLLKNIVFESSIAANSIADCNGVITHVNDAFLKLWGYKNKKEAMGNSVGDFFVNQEDAAPVLEALNKKGKWEGEFLAKKKNGSTFISRGLATTIKDKNGEMIGYQSANIDVTAEREAEEKIISLNTTLEKHVKERTHQLEEANKELESFCYSVSHDLRAPLRAITGYSTILLEECKNNLGKNEIDLVHTITKNTQRMSQLINDILSFSRLSRKEIRKQKLNMKRKFITAFNELEQNYPPRKIHFIINDLPEITGDDSMIHQVITNLLSNAIKYSLNEEAPVIEIKAQERANEIVYQVKDNGIGIQKKYSEKIFEVFQRLHTDKEFEGTGIGLAIVKRIISKHGGNVWVKSELNKGATFYFSIPKY